MRSHPFHLAATVYSRHAPAQNFPASEKVFGGVSPSVSAFSEELISKKTGKKEKDF
jgi:hypothetical protein